MDKDDPFAIPSDSDRTVMKPTPGGRRQAPSGDIPPPPQPRAAPPPMRPTERPVIRSGLNPLVDAAGALLSLVGQLRNAVRHPDVNGLRSHVAEEIKRFEQDARSHGLAPETVLAARYAICTLLDETVLSTPWGSESAWSKQSLLSVFHNETWGGEKFFVILDRISDDPTRNLDLMELMYICIALGFEGKYRVLERGRAKLEEIQDNLFRRIRNQRGEHERELSPHWEGVVDRRNVLIRYVPLWVVAAVAGALLLGTYAGFSWFLNKSSGPVEQQLESISPLPPTQKQS